MNRERASRLSRQGRRDQILDSAKSLILTRGLSQCTLEAVAIEAGISKALIYRHFSAVDELLKALLEREYRPSDADLAVRDATDFMDRVRLGLRRTLGYCADNGAIVHMLLSDPGIAQLLGADALPDAQSLHRTYAGHAAATYGLPGDIASVVAFLMLNAAAGSGDGLARTGVSADQAAELWTTFCQAGWEAVAARYGQPPAKRD